MSYLNVYVMEDVLINRFVTTIGMCAMQWLPAGALSISPLKANQLKPRFKKKTFSGCLTSALAYPGLAPSMSQSPDSLMLLKLF